MIKIRHFIAAILPIVVLAVFLVYPVLAATITVTNGDDSGPGSLRQAIANAQPGDTITFTGDTSIILSTPLTITKNLTLDGEDHAITISGNNAVRVFAVDSAAHVTFDHLTITNGEVASEYGGAGLYVEFGAVVTLTNSAILSNTTSKEDGYGGGIYNHGGTVTVQNSTISGNSVPNSGEGGGIYSSGAWCGADGEDICEGVMTIQNSTISGNSATCGGGGGIVNDWYSTMTMSDSTISDNLLYYGGYSCEASGGGIHNEGVLTITHSSIFGNNTSETYSGGGLANYLGTLTVLNSTIFSNTAGGNGGGIDNWYQAMLVVQNCTIYSNTAAYDGGGIYSGGPSSSEIATLELINSALFGNSAQNGGGIYIARSSLTATNSTLYNNVATGSGSDGNGGGFYNRSAAPTLVNSILWGNIANVSGAQIYNDDTDVPVISYSNIDGSGGSAGWDTALGSDGGGNIDADPSFVDATHGDLRLQLDSPAIDAGDNSAVPSGISIDLAGAPRFMDVTTASDTGSGAPPIVDMGAYETGPALALQKLVVPAEMGVVTYTLILTNSGTLDDAVTLTDTLPTGVIFGGWVSQPVGMMQHNNTLTRTGTVTAGVSITAIFTATFTGSYGDIITNIAHFSGTVQTDRTEAAFTITEASKIILYLPLVWKE
jgi:hypothetical protein